MQRGDEEKFFKDSPKHSPNLKGPTALWRKSHYPLLSMQLKCKDWKTFWRKQRLQKCANGQGMAIFGRSPKTRIFRKSANGRPRKIFQKSPKKYPRLQRAKATLAKISLSSNFYPFILQRLDKILAHKVAPKVPEWPSYGNFRQATQTRIVWESAKGGPRQIFQKSAKR